MQNWPDLRWPESANDPDRAPCAYYWCHGSAGIALARMDTLSVHRDEHVLREIEVAVKATAARGFRSDHSLCHGYASAAELMMLAGQAGMSTSLQPAGGSWGGEMLHDIRKSGCSTGYPLGIEIPGLMMGIAGIGYGLLRLAAPERVPSVVLLEAPRHSGCVASHPELLPVINAER
jgi:lantibiotic modifying enzyme